MPRVLKYGHFKIVFLPGAHGRHLRDILGRLVHHDVHGIIDCDNAHHQPVLIQDRESEQVVPGEEPRHFLLVCVRVHGDDLRLHQVSDQQIVIGSHQVFGADDADQFSLIRNIAGVDCFFMDPGLFDMRHGLGYSHGFPDIHIFCGHDAPGAVVGIIQELVDQLPVRCADRVQDTVHKICRKFFEKIHSIVHVQVIQQFF